MVLQLQHNTRILFTTTKTGIKKPPVDFLLIFNPKQGKKKARNVQKTAQLQGFLMLCVLSLAELRRAPCGLEAVLLSLLHSRVTCEETGLLQSTSKFGIEIQKSP